MHDKVNGDLSWEEYWTTVRDVKNSTGQPKFPNLTKFVQILATFRSSKVAMERIFSSLKMIKTDRRVSLKSSSLVSLLQFIMAIKKRKVFSRYTQTKRKHAKLASKQSINQSLFIYTR